MSTVHIEAEIPTDSLVTALQNLPPTELDRILDRLQAHRTGRRTLSLTPAETALLERINSGASPAERREYEALQPKLEQGNISEAEHARLTALTDRMEELQADRISAVAEMASLRNVAFRDLWLQLGLGPEPYA